jgi:hypothetical protein
MKEKRLEREKNGKVEKEGRCNGGRQNKNEKRTGEEKQDEDEHVACGKRGGEGG